MEQAVESPIEAAPAIAPEAPAEVSREIELSPRGAIDRAFAALDEAAPRDETGKFAAKEPEKTVESEAEKEVAVEAEAPATSFAEAPKRFSPDAKAVWNAAPEPIKAEITRAVTELENGLNEYRQKWEPLKDFEQLAKQNNTSIDAALKNYVDLDMAIQQNPIQGLERICKNIGISLRDVATHVLGQDPNQYLTQQESVIRELQQELQAIKSHNEQATRNQIDAFAAEKPRFDELADDIALLIQTGKAKGLQQAYELAERLNPAPQQPEAKKDTAPTPQPRKGSLSLTGAPSTGSNPASRKPPSTARDAIDNAFARIGL
jgi:hypothetical protein